MGKPTDLSIFFNFHFFAHKLPLKFIILMISEIFGPYMGLLQIYDVINISDNVKILSWHCNNVQLTL